MPTFDFVPGDETYSATQPIKYGVIYNPGDGSDILNVWFPGPRFDNFVIDLRGFPSVQSIDDVLALASDNPKTVRINFGNGDVLAFQDLASMIPLSKVNLRNADYIFGKTHDTGDSTGTLTSGTGQRADGTYAVTQRDGGDAFVWQTYTDEFNASGQRIEQRIIDDDFKSHRQFFDVTDRFDYSNVTQDFNEQTQLTRQRAVLDEGGLAVHYWDRENLYDWTEVNEDYDSAGRRIEQSVYNDDGSRHSQYFDAENTQNWSTVIDYFDTTGFRDRQYIGYDDGTSVWVNF